MSSATRALSKARRAHGLQIEQRVRKPHARWRARSNRRRPQVGHRAWSNDCGQATVEAAFALPVLMVLLLLLLQPGIVLYDRIVMSGAAAEGCRLLATTTSSNASTNDDYIRRRLSAIPQIDQFHVHSSGCTWDIECTGDEGSDEVTVRIATEVKPLPLLDFGMALAGLSNAAGNLVVEVEVSERVQPEWISGVSEGRDPSAWPGI